MDEYVFVLGSETAPRLRSLLEDLPPGEGLKAGRMGADLIGNRSDYGPFRDRRVPFLFFSTGQHPDYHRPSDLPERVDYEKLRRVAVWISRLTWRVANDDEAPAWEDGGKPDLEEARTAMVLMERVLDRPRALPLSAGQQKVVAGVLERLRGIVERGAVTREERSWLVWTSRLLLATVF
jgi:hypothetical protein